MEPEEVEQEPEADFNLPLLVDSAGRVTVHFEFAALTIDSGVTVELVPVALIDTKLLVAIPSSAWHRQSARRVLPSEGFSRIVPVDVLQCALSDRSVPLEATTRVWMGFVEQDLMAEMVSADDVECLDHQFLVGNSPGYLPYLDDRCGC